MAGPKLHTYEITTDDGKVYHVDAYDDAQAARLGDFIKQQVAAGNPQLQGVELPDKALVEQHVIEDHTPVEEKPKGDGGKGFLDTGMGLALRGIIKGATSLPALTMDTIGGNPGETSQAIDSLLTGAGFRQPREGDDGRIDRLIQAGFEGVGGTAATGGMGAALETGGAKFAPNLLTASPMMQTGSAALGSTAGQLVAENGGDAKSQILAAILAGSAPGLLKTGASAAIRGAVRGANPDRVRDAIETFQTAGTMPTVADATGGDKAKAVEGFLSQFFGSSGIVRKQRLAQEQQIGGNLENRANELYPAMTNEDAGAYISSNAEEGFKPQGRQILDRDYAMLEKQLPSTTRVDMTPFREYVGQKSAIPDIASKTMTNPLIGGDQANWASLGKDLDADMKAAMVKTGQGGLPLSDVKELRSRIGRKIEDAAFNESGGNIADLRGAYGVLSETLKDAADKAGPAARKAFDKAQASANWYHDILETVKPVIDKSGGFEKVFTSSLAGTKDGGTIIRNVYHLLSPDARNAMTSQILRRAARPASGDPEAFDMVRFAKNYRNMDQEAKKVIFPGQYQEDLDKVSKAILTMQKTKEEGGVANSAAQGRLGAQAIMMSPVYMLAGIGTGAATSHPLLGTLAASAIPAGLMGSRKLAKWMVNPQTVHFLAETTKLPKEQIPIAINNFAITAEKQQDPDMIDLANYLKSQGDENAF